MSNIIRTSVNRLALLTLCVAAAACAHGTSSGARASRAIFTTETSRPDSVVVRVVNNVARPVTVYRVGKGTRAPLGKVSAGTDGRFALRAADVTGRMMLAATPVGDKTTVESAPFRVEKGQVAVFVITPELGGSQVYVNWPKH